MAHIKLLSTNILKVHCIQFKTKNATLTETKNNSVTTEVPHTKFLGLETENTLSWNIHTNNVIKKFTTVYYMLRSAKPYINLSSLILIYYSLFHSELCYDIIF